MRIVTVSVGVALVIWSVVLTVLYASALHRRGEPARRALRWFLRRPTFWAGAVLVLAAVNPIAASALLVAFVVLALVLLVRRPRRR